MLFNGDGQSNLSVTFYSNSEGCGWSVNLKCKKNIESATFDSDFVGRLANFVGSAWTGVRLQRRQTPADTTDSSWGEGAATESPPLPLRRTKVGSSLGSELGEDQLPVLEGRCGSAQF